MSGQKVDVGQKKDVEMKAVSAVQTEKDVEKAGDEVAGDEVPASEEKNCLIRSLALRPILTFFLFFLFAGLLAGGGASQLVVSDPGNRDFFIFDDPIVMLTDAVSLAADELSSTSDSEKEAERSNDQNFWGLILMVKAKDGNMLTPANLNVLRSTEKWITDRKDYGSFCLGYKPEDKDKYAEGGEYFGTPSGCSYNAIETITSFFPEGGTQAEYDAIAKNKTFWEQYPETGASFDKEFSSDNPKATHLRSFIKFGAPLKGYAHENDRKEEQRKKFVEWITPIASELAYEKSTDKVDVLVYGLEATNVLINEVFASDTSFAGLSLLFVFCYVAFHTESCFLSGIGILGILLSLPIAFLFYNPVFGVEFFGSLHNLVVFIILGIGADDIFVFTDAWNQYPGDQKDLVGRMGFTYRRATKAMAVTSFTTISAFLATATSDIMPVSSFGIWAGLVIFVNFCLVITLYPAAVVIWEKWIRHNKCCCCCPKKEDESNKDVRQPSKVEVFFETTWTEFVFGKRYVIIVVFLLMLIAGIGLGLQMEGLTKKERFFPREHPIEVTSDVLDTAYKQGDLDDFIEVEFSWGISGLDRSKASYYDPTYIGEVIFDNDFDVSSTTGQQFIYDTCQDLKTKERVYKVYCFMESYKTWRLQSNNTFPADFSAVPAEQKTQFTKSLGDFAVSSLGSYFYRKKHVGLDLNSLDLKFVKVTATTNTKLFLPHAITNLEYERWEDYSSALNAKAPAGITNCKQSTVFSWAWMLSEVAFVSNAIKGMLISVAISFAMLIISTRDVVISAFAIVTIAGIVSCVSGFIYIMGWEMGVTESISLVILVGFSVDYVVHLGNSFIESQATDRKERMRDSLKEIGVSVLGGALTTFGSSQLLWFCVSTFFFKFAALMSLTIFFSLTWALVFFSATCMAFGPQPKVYMEATEHGMS